MTQPRRRPGRIPRAALLVVTAVTLPLCGCSGTVDEPSSVGAAATGLPVDAATDGAVRIFFLTANGPWPVWRNVDDPNDPQDIADALAGGPTADERERGITSALPSDTAGLSAMLSSAGDGVEVVLPWKISSTPVEAVGQVVCSFASIPGLAEGLDPTEVIVSLREPAPYDDETLPLRCDANGVMQTVAGP